MLLALLVLVAVVAQVRASVCIDSCVQTTGSQKCFSNFMSNVYDHSDMECLCKSPDFFSNVTKCFTNSSCLSVDVSDFWNTRNSQCGYSNPTSSTVEHTGLSSRHIIFLTCAAVFFLVLLSCCIRKCCYKERGKVMYVAQAKYYQPSAYPVGSEVPGQYYVSAAAPPPPYTGTSNVVSTPYGGGKLV